MAKWNPAVLSIFNKIKNKKPLYKVISGDMLRAVEKNFDTQGSRLGKRWQRLKPQTLRRKRKKGQSLSILQSSGAAIRSLNRKSTNQFAAVSLPPATARYMATHILGLTITYPPRSNISSRTTYKKGTTFKGHTTKFPVRDPFQLTESDFKKIEERILDHVTE